MKRQEQGKASPADTQRIASPSSPSKPRSVLNVDDSVELERRLQELSCTAIAAAERDRQLAARAEIDRAHKAEEAALVARLAEERKRGLEEERQEAEHRRQELIERSHELKASLEAKDKETTMEKQRSLERQREEIHTMETQLRKEQEETVRNRIETKAKVSKEIMDFNQRQKQAHEDQRRREREEDRRQAEIDAARARDEMARTQEQETRRRSLEREAARKSLEGRAVSPSRAVAMAAAADPPAKPIREIEAEQRMREAERRRATREQLAAAQQEYARAKQARQEAERQAVREERERLQREAAADREARAAAEAQRRERSRAFAEEQLRQTQETRRRRQASAGGGAEKIGTSASVRAFERQASSEAVVTCSETPAEKARREDEIKQTKITQLRSQGVPEKYLTDIKRLHISAVVSPF